MKIKSKNKRGFSLVELMIVISIIGIMSVLGMASFRSSRAYLNLDLSQRELAAAIKLAQSYAIQGKTQIVAGEEMLPCGYGLRFTEEKKFEIFFNKNPETETCQKINQTASAEDMHFGNQSVSAETFEFKEGVTLEGVSDFATTEIYFTIPHANVYNYAGNLLLLEKEYVLAYPDLEETKTVKVNARGAINEN
jgi:prepilin-type N-terminal cleavage/methylation domain-containing protein